MSMNFISSGLGYANPRRDTMQSVAPRGQNAPALTASKMPVSPTARVVVSGGAQGSAFGNDALVSGRLSLGFVASLIVILALAYMWTRNVQGGG